MQDRGRRLAGYFTAALLAFSLFFPLPGFAGEPPESVAIVYVMDTSGSVDRTDPSMYAADALKLGIDLAPQDARVAIVSFNTGIVSETALADTATADGRALLKDHIRQFTNSGDTDFASGISRAWEILDASDASERRIVVLGDFIEGGYNAGGAEAEAETAAAIQSIASRADEAGIVMDMLLWGSAPENSRVASALRAAATQTGGEMVELDTPDGLPAAVEGLYFRNYPYLQAVTGIRGKSSHVFTVTLPTEHAKRVRVYISAAYPVDAVSVSHSGSGLEGEQNPSYTLFDLDYPARDTFHFTLTPGDSGEAAVYLLMDYDLTVVASVTDETELAGDGKAYIQTTTLQAQIVDAGTREPLISDYGADSVAYKLQVHTPSGEAVPESESTSPITYAFQPTEFGAYTVYAQLTVGDLTLSAGPVAVEIADVRPDIEPVNWILIAAIVLGSAIIATAILIAYRYRKKENEILGAVEMASDYHFHGKLHICAVMVDGGNKDIPPFHFILEQLESEKRVTLKQVLNSGHVVHDFPGAENILFLVGPENSIIIRNNSNVTIRAMGKDYGPRSKLQLFYGQKIYVIFEKDENELEIFYRPVKVEGEPARVRISSSSRRDY